MIISEDLFFDILYSKCKTQSSLREKYRVILDYLCGERMLLTEEDFPRIELILDKIDVNKIHIPHLGMAILRELYFYRSKISNWYSFRDNFAEYLEETNYNNRYHLLRGLFKTYGP